MIDLRAHPEYWARLGGLLEALRPLIFEDNAVPYCVWLREHRNRTEAQIVVRVGYMRQMITEIKANGYDVERWRQDPRQFNPELTGFGPISVTVTSRGRVVFPRDGAHRSCVLLHLGLPVEAFEYRPK
ncbi:MAG: hypothetical protein WAV09_03255 [Minisyncoccia bacterium]